MSKHRRVFCVCHRHKMRTSVGDGSVVPVCVIAARVKVTSMCMLGANASSRGRLSSRIGIYLCYVSTQEATGGSDNDRNISETPSKMVTQKYCDHRNLFRDGQSPHCILLCIYHTHAESTLLSVLYQLLNISTVLRK